MKNKEYFQFLVQAAVIDGVLRPEELNLLQNFASRLKLDEQQTAEVWNAVRGGAGLPLTLPKKPQEVQQLLRHMARVIVVDGRLAPQELNLINKFGFRLGLDQDTVKDLIDKEMAKVDPAPVNDAAPEPASHSLPRHDPHSGPSTVNNAALEPESHSSPDKPSQAARRDQDDEVLKPKEYFQFLVQAAVIDGVLRSEELSLLENFASRLKLDEKKAAEVWDAVQGGEALPLTLPKKPQEIQQLLRYMARVIVVDGRLAPQELNLINKFGFRLGLDQDAVKDLIDKEMAKVDPAPVNDAALEPESHSHPTKPRDQVDPSSKTASETTKTPDSVSRKGGRRWGAVKKRLAVHKFKGGRRWGAVKKRLAVHKFKAMAFFGGILASCLIATFIIFNSIDFNKNKRKAFQARVGKLTLKSGYRLHDQLLTELTEFIDSTFDSVDLDAGKEMKATVEERISSAKKTLNRKYQTLIAADFDTKAKRQAGNEFANALMAWKNVDSSFSRKVNELHASIRTAVKWRDFALEVAHQAKESMEPIALNMHHLVALESATEADQKLSKSFEKAMKKSDTMPIPKLFDLISSERFHPLFPPKAYNKLLSLVTNVLVKQKFTGLRAKDLSLFKNHLKKARDLEADYRKVLTRAFEKLQSLDLEGLKAEVKKAEFPTEFWMAQVKRWVESDKCKTYLNVLASRRRKTDTQKKVEVKAEAEPEEVQEEEIVSEEELASEEEQVDLTYKEEFELLLSQYRSARRSDKVNLTQEMEEVMKKSLALANDSPAMAMDVAAFYKKRKSKFRREKRLKALFDQSVAVAFDVCLPANTGPSGYTRLEKWCQENSYKQGMIDLKPYLQRCQPRNPRHPIFARELSARNRQSVLLVKVQNFLSQRRVDNAKSIRKLLRYLRRRQHKSTAIEKQLAVVVDRIIRKVGKDKVLANQFMTEYRDIKTKTQSPKAKERLEKTVTRRIEELVRKAETALLKGVQMAIKGRFPAVAYDLLQLVLTINPGSSRAYKGLKYVNIEGAWHRAWHAALMKKGYRYDPDIGYHKGEKQAGKYFEDDWQDLNAANKTHSDGNDPWALKSEHFELYSTASLKESHFVLRRLEAFYLQLFRQFDLYFAPTGDPFVVFAMAEKPIMKVYYYRDRQQFMKFSNPPVNWAAGFYSPGTHASYFYSTPGSWTVLQHEIVHQILGENASGGALPWLAEGTAVYMENAYFNQDQQLKLGPVERHERCYRYLGEAQSGSVSISFDKILSLDTSGKWGSGNISNNYKGAGSVIYFFMTFDDGRYRTTFLNYLRDAYNQEKSRDYEHYFGLSHDNLRWFFDVFYKSGFVPYNGRLVTHEEKFLYDRERILRDYPEPDLKEIQKKLASGRQKPKAEPEKRKPEKLKSLEKRLLFNPKMKP